MKNNIPQGYKATALGIIPQEWEVMPLSKAFHLQSGYAFKSELFSADQGMPVVRISNLPIDNKYVDLSDCVYYPASENIKQQFIVHKKDLLIAMSGATTGKTAIYNYSYNAFLNQRVGVFKQTSDKVCCQYLQAIIESHLFTTRLRPLLIAGAQPNISPSDIENMIFPFPPLAEQRKIAEVLGVWDEAIEKQARLIEKLALRKRALMQRLLSAKLRLPGFSEPWKKVKLGDVASIKTGNKNNEDKIANGQYPFFVRSSIVERINTYSYDGEAILIPGEGKIGEIIHYINGKFDYHQRVYKISDFSNCSGLFLYYYLMYFFGKQAINNSVKACVDSLRLSTFTNMTIIHPPISEQTAIAEVLTAADREIELAKEKLERLRRQKRGLMQQLLTGKKRIKY